MIGGELFISTAKLDHMIFKSQGYSAAIKSEHVDISRDHTTCNLGKWYANEGKAEFSNIPAFGAIDKTHKEVHENVANAMDLVDKKDSKYNDEIIRWFKEAEKSSDELCILLDSLIAR